MVAALHRISRGGRRFFYPKNLAVVRRALHTPVWWDMDSCNVPKGCDASAITGNITRALANLSYDAPVTISAYGNTYLIPLKVQHALSDSGVSLIHAVDDPRILLFLSLLFSYFDDFLKNFSPVYLIDFVLSFLFLFFFEFSDAFVLYMSLFQFNWFIKYFL